MLVGVGKATRARRENSTKEVSDGVFEKRQIRFKLTAIVIQVEVSLHILPTIAEHRGKRGCQLR